MKTKLISLIWRGSASVDPRFSVVMLPWAVADICNRDTYENLSVGVEGGVLEAYNCDFESQFNHSVKFIVGLCKVVARAMYTGRRNCIDYAIIENTADSKVAQERFITIVGPQQGLLYLLKDPNDPLLHIHLYESDSTIEISELLHQLKDPAYSIGGSVGNIPSSFIDTLSRSADSSQQGAQNIHTTPASNLKSLEGVKNAHHDGSPSIVSGKMPKSKSLTNGLNSAGTIQLPRKNINESISPLLEISPNSTQFFEVMYIGKIKVSHKRVPYTFIDDALPKFKAYDAQKIKMQAQTNCLSVVDSEQDSYKRDSNSEKESNESDTKTPTNELQIVEEDLCDERSKGEFQEKILNTRISEENKENNLPLNRKLLLRGQSQVVLPVKFDHAISLPLPQPPRIVEDFTEPIPKQRDRSASIGAIPLVEQNRTMVFLVGKSDMRLISPDRKQVLLYKDFKDVASCAQGHKNADHFGIICREHNNEGYIGYVFKCQSDSVADDIVASISQAFHSCSEQQLKDRNQLFSCDHCPMLWYHKLCSDIDGLSDKKMQITLFKRIEMLSDDEQNVILAKYYGAEEMAFHSIGEQNQFLMMLLRAHCESRQQRHVHDTAENRSEFLNQYLGGSTIFMKAKRSLTSSFDHLLKRKNSKDDFGATAKDVQIKEDNKKVDNIKSDDIRPRASSFGAGSSNRPNADTLKSPMMDIFIKVGNNPRENQNQTGSWRQEMLNRVVTPSKNQDSHVGSGLMSPYILSRKENYEKRSATELRKLWRTAIRQTITLARMEKENARLQASHNEHELKKIKLDYDEIIPCDKQAIERWDTIIDKELRISNKRDPKALFQSIKTGVPRSKRGDIWLFLAEQYSMNTAPVDIKKFPNFNTSYKILLNSLTEHQHAIFIDLGRTFPNHTYYKASLGVGQLSLFNILKAYSILDPELGYCQGLGFICGVLLLHCDEEQAFNLLKHLMFRRQMRNKYLPDMKQFQLQLYQLSRLIRDLTPDLYEWLDQNEVSPTLYAAPWILTVFSSQFPLGFVTRIFDLLFLESPEIIFKVGIALLDLHKDELMKRDNFEDIMDYLKNVITKVDAPTLETIMKEVFSMDIRKQLSEYQVEYNVLQEEISTTNHHLDALKREKEQNHHLEMQLQFAQSSISQLEQTRLAQQVQIKSLHSQIQSLEVTVHTLGNFMSQMTDKHTNLEMPGEIRRIVQQVCNNAETRKKPVFIERKIGKSMSVNAQLGFPLKVLEELNESLEKEPNESSSTRTNKTPFFENTYQKIRQKNQMRPTRLDPKQSMEIRLPAHVEKAIESMTSSKQIDSGISTPISPPNSVHSIAETTQFNDYSSNIHPFSNCEDVNFKFNGTTQLKSIRPHQSSKPTEAMASHSNSDNEKNGRS